MNRFFIARPFRSTGLLNRNATQNREDVTGSFERLLRVWGLPVNVAAERFGVSLSTLKSWRRLIQEAPADYG